VGNCCVVGVEWGTAVSLELTGNCCVVGVNWGTAVVEVNWGTAVVEVNWGTAASLELTGELLCLWSEDGELLCRSS